MEQPDASNATGHDSDARAADALGQHQALQDRTAGKQGIQGALRDTDIQKAQLLEKRKAERAGAGAGGVPVVRETAAAEAGDAKGGPEAGDQCRQRLHRSPGAQVEVELELPEVMEGGGPEPAVQRRGGVRVAFEVAPGDGEAAAGAGVRGEDT